MKSSGVRSLLAILMAILMAVESPLITLAGEREVYEKEEGPDTALAFSEGETFNEGKEEVPEKGEAGKYLDYSVLTGNEFLVFNTDTAGNVLSGLTADKAETTLDLSGQFIVKSRYDNGYGVDYIALMEADTDISKANFDWDKDRIPDEIFLLYSRSMSKDSDYHYYIDHLGNYDEEADSVDKGLTLTHWAGYYRQYVPEGQYRFIQYRNIKKAEQKVPTIYYSEQVYTITDTKGTAKNQKNLIMDFYDVKDGDTYGVSDPALTEPGRKGLVYFTPDMTDLYLSIQGYGHKITTKENVYLDLVKMESGGSISGTLYPQSGDWEGSSGSSSGPKTTVIYDEKTDTNYLEHLSLYDESGSLRLPVDYGTCYRASVEDYSVSGVEGADSKTYKYLETGPEKELYIFTTSLPLARYGEEYSADLKAIPGKGGTVEWAWDLTDDKVKGLSLSSDGHISGIPTENTAGEKPGSVTVTVTATEKDGSGEVVSGPVTQSVTLRFDLNWHFTVKGLVEGESAALYAVDAASAGSEVQDDQRVGLVRNGNNSFAESALLSSMGSMSKPVFRLYRYWGLEKSLELEIPYVSGQRTYEMTAVALYDTYGVQVLNSSGEILNGISAVLKEGDAYLPTLTTGRYILYGGTVQDPGSLEAELSSASVEHLKAYKLEEGSTDISIDKENKLVSVKVTDRKQSCTLSGKLSGYNEFTVTDADSLAKWKERAASDPDITISGNVVRKALKVSEATIVADQTVGSAVISATAKTDPEGSFIVEGLLEGLEITWRISSEDYAGKEGIVNATQVKESMDLGTVDLGVNRSGQSFSFLVEGLSGGAAPGAQNDTGARSMAALLNPSVSVNGAVYPVEFKGYVDETGNPNYDPRTEEKVYASYGIVVPAAGMGEENQVVISGLPGGDQSVTLPQLKETKVVVTDEATGESREETRTVEVYESGLQVSGYGLLDWSRVPSIGGLNVYAFPGDASGNSEPTAFFAKGKTFGILPAGSYQLILSSVPVNVYGDYDKTKMLLLSGKNAVTVTENAPTILSDQLDVPVMVTDPYAKVHFPEKADAGKSFEIEGRLYPNGYEIKRLDLTAPGLCQLILDGKTVSGKINTGGYYSFYFEGLSITEKTRFKMKVILPETLAGSGVYYGIYCRASKEEVGLGDFVLADGTIKCGDPLTLSVPKRVVANDGTAKVNYHGTAQSGTTVGIYRGDELLSTAPSNGQYWGSLTLPTTEAIQGLTARYITGGSKEEAKTALRVLAGGPELKQIYMDSLCLTPGEAAQDYIVRTDTMSPVYKAIFILPENPANYEDYFETVSYVCEGEKEERSGKIFFKIRTTGGSYIVPASKYSTAGTYFTAMTDPVDQGGDTTMGITVLYELKNSDKAFSYVYRDSVFTDGNGNGNVSGRSIGKSKAEELQAQVAELQELENEYKKLAESGGSSKLEELKAEIDEKQRALDVDLNYLAAKEGDLLSGETEISWAGNADGSNSAYSDVGYSIKTPDQLTGVGDVPEAEMTGDSTLSSYSEEEIPGGEELLSGMAGIKIGDWGSLLNARTGDIQKMIETLNATANEEFGEDKAAAWQVGNLGAAVADDEFATATTFVDYAKAVNEEMMPIMGYQLSDFSYTDSEGKERTSRMYTATTYYAYSGLKVFNPQTQINEIASVLQTHILLNPEVSGKNNAYRWLRIQYAVAIPGAAVPIYTNGFVCPIASWFPAKYTSAEEVEKSWGSGTNAKTAVKASGEEPEVTGGSEGISVDASENGGISAGEGVDGEPAALGGTGVTGLKYKKIQNERKRNEDGFYDTNTGGIFGTGIRVNIDTKAFGWGTWVGITLLGCSMGLKVLDCAKLLNANCLKGIDKKWVVAKEITDDGYDGVGFARRVYGEIGLSYGKPDVLVDFLSVTTNATSVSSVDDPLGNMGVNLRDAVRYMGSLKTKYHEWESIPETDTNTMLAKYMNMPKITPEKCDEALKVLLECQQELTYLRQEVEGAMQQQDFTNITTNLLGFAAVPAGAISSGWGGMAYSAVSSWISGANDTRLCDLGAKVERYQSTWEKAKKAAATLGFDLQTGKPITSDPKDEESSGGSSSGGSSEGGGSENDTEGGRSTDTPPSDDVTVNGKQDPSGFVFEAVLSNRIQGAKVSLFAGTEGYQPSYDEELVTNPYQTPNNLPFTAALRVPEGDEIIPAVPVQTTDQNGFYQWFVDEGLWYVTAEKEGYASGTSAEDVAASATVNGTNWLPVLPEQLNVNIPLVDATTLPMPAEILIKTDGVYIAFNKYMQEESLGLSEGADLSKYYELTDEKGNKLSFTIESLDSEQAPDNIVYTDGAPSYTSKLVLKFASQQKEGSSVSLTLKAGDGQFISYAGTVMAEDQFLTDEVTAKESTAAPVMDPAPGDTDGNGEITITSSTEGAVIYYTLDGSDPLDKSNERRFIYRIPLEGTAGTVIKAAAVRLGSEDSKITVADYSAEAEGNAADDTPKVREVILKIDGKQLESGSEISMENKTTKQLVATALDEDAADRTIRFESSDASVVRISSTGYMTALLEGEAVITASGVGIEPVWINVKVVASASADQRSIHFGSEDGSVSEINLSRRNITIKPGESAELYALVTPEDTSSSISWYKTKGAASKVYVYGSAVRIVAGEKNESFNVRAASGNSSALCSVKVASEVKEGDTPKSGLWVAGLYTGKEDTLKEAYTYTGLAITPGLGFGPELRVYYDSDLLVPGTDYKLSYKNNINAAALTDSKAPTVTVKLIGSYKKKKGASFNFAIAKKGFSDGDVIKNPVSALTDKGKAVKLSPALYYNGKLLKAGKDYDIISAGPFTDAGNYSIDLAGNGNFEGTDKLAVSLRDKGELKDISKVKVTVKEGTSTDSAGGKPEFILTDKTGNVLTEGAENDYTETYSGTVQPGTAIAVFTATDNGQYYGSCKVKVSVGKQDISDTSVIRISMSHSLPYQKSGVKPSVIITDSRFSPVRVLTEGVDYTVKYTNNKTVTTKDTKKMPGVVIKGKGNYSGTVNRSFLITPQDISELLLFVDDVVYTGKADAYKKAKVTLMDQDGKVVSNKEYSITFGTEDPDPAKGSVIMVNVTAKSADAASKKDRGSGCYTGSAVSSFKLIDKSSNISGAKVSFTNGGLEEFNGRSFVFKGKAVEPGAGNMQVTLKVKENGTNTVKTLVWGTDYLITGYEKNEGTGTGKLTIKGIGAMGGRKTVSFKME